MGSIKEALLRNGVFLYNNNGTTYTIEDGAGNYMIVRDKNGMAKYRIENSAVYNRLNVVDYYTGGIVDTIAA